MADPASVVSQGTESILSAYRAKGAAQANLGGAVASGIGNLGVGIFRQAQKAKEEKEIASIDEAIKSSQMLGDPGATAEVLSKMQGGLKTHRGKQYLLQSIEGFRKTVSTLLDDKYKQAQIDWNKARAAEEGKTELSKTEEKKAYDRWWNMYGGIYSESPRSLPPQARASMPPSLREDYARMVQGGQTREDAARVAAEKSRRKSLWDTARAQGLVPVEDPDTGEVTFKPDVTSERFKAGQVERAARDKARAARLAKIDAREEDAAEAKDRATSMAAVMKAAALAKSALTGLIDQDGDPVNEDDADEVADLRKRLVNYANQFPEKAAEIMGGDGPAPTQGDSPQMDDAALAAKYQSTPEGPEKVNLWNEIQRRKASRGK